MTLILMHPIASLALRVAFVPSALQLEYVERILFFIYRKLGPFFRNYLEMTLLSTRRPFDSFNTTL